MSLEKVKMPELDPKVRATNFEEVALGYTPEMAQEESNRCLECKNKPCVSGCPVPVSYTHLTESPLTSAIRRMERLS